MRSLALAAIILAFGMTAVAATPKEVSYKSGDDTVHALLYTPSGKGPFPGIVVVHEWWGLNDWVKEQASKLSDQGYVALAIDLYRTKVATDPEQAHELMRGLPEDRVSRDLNAAFDFIKSQNSVKPDRIASIGWCMGGGISLDMALQQPTLRAAVINYGHLATDPASLHKINAAILGIFAGKDQGIEVADVKKFEQALKQDGKTVDIVIYPDAGHAFENPNNKGGYRAADAADAWNRTVKFLDANLKK
ncbi:MAG: dienelactone hydrolase family protein [Acidobacteriales bacterium]|nr:dienelactone hydrolase family protein [Terriglobales bacterium]